jgi:hypothetical protein
MGDGGLELLAPAGDWTAMEAVLRAGADAVYFGLSTLNARRRAKNFTQEEFARAVAAIHERGARAYLTLNIDLSERELGQAARILELARQCGVDAVLVRDPALLAVGQVANLPHVGNRQQRRIAGQHGVDAALPREFEDPRRLAQFPLAEVDVQRQIRPRAALVDGGHRADELFLAEVLGAAAGVERAQAEVHGVGPGLQRRFHRRPIAGRGQ